jgi:hypothetical protein
MNASNSNRTKGEAVTTETAGTLTTGGTPTVGRREANNNENIRNKRDSMPAKAVSNNTINSKDFSKNRDAIKSS